MYHLNNLYKFVCISTVPSTILFIDQCFCICNSGHLWRNHFRESPSENRDGDLSEDWRPPSRFIWQMRLTSATECAASLRARLRFGSDYEMRVCTCMTVRLALQCFKAKCRRSLISTKRKLAF